MLLDEKQHEIKYFPVRTEVSSNKIVRHAVPLSNEKDNTDNSTDDKQQLSGSVW